ncbi:uridine diphosphate glucose pyrophosphatase NUDT14-like [Drosophila ficusphila]|uniref:uridine diphosphate glucose pyrophosphatase NUDT14-like n=1 Tax=Drosophila ficusphila TaxID=30025 RepID=UPI0007E893C2|nr:uridine diphosphate glucose pyrophosphatase NUDT14-like [Drosophila ficusphila]
MSVGEADLEKFPPEVGVTLELCGGAVDKDKSVAEIAKEEVLEECGYDVPTEDLELVYDYRSGIGTSSSSMSMYYCEVCDEQRISKGGGVDNEEIQVVEMSLEQSRKLVETGATTNGGPSCMVGLLWFFLHKAPKVSN